MYFREIIMWLNLRLALYGFTCFAGLAWPFYFIVKFANQVKDGIVTGSPLEIGQNFFNGHGQLLPQDLFLQTLLYF